MTSVVQTPNPAQSQPAQPAARRPHRHRRPRGDRATAETTPATTDSSGPPTRPTTPRNPALAFRPASLAPPGSPRSNSALPVTTNDHAHQHGRPHESHSHEQVHNHTHVQDQISTGGGGGRQRGRGGQARNQHTVLPHRQFGGTLTSADDDASSILSGDAPEFTPGQTAIKAGGPRQQRRQPQRQRRMSKSTAPDISTRIHEDIDNGQYECPICTSEVLRRSKVWSCHLCWTVFHLDCVKKWANNSEAAAAAAQNSDAQGPRQWRCPGCNLPQETKPGQYTCWCGKEHEPRPIPGLTPHSCGQSCGFTRPCGHPCELLCHAGPHPPCTFTQQELCFCGKQSATRKCTGTGLETGWSCGQPCGEVLGCGEHIHDAPCHAGLCGACEETIEATCYCGKETKNILCCDKDDEKTSFKMSTANDGSRKAEEFTGCFVGKHNCDTLFDCNKHSCQKSCHPKDAETQHCPRSPDVVSHCACGKTTLQEMGIDRSTCEDDIPNCTKVCGKPLGCGHQCKAVCHTGDCPSCLEKVEITCRCGRTTSSTVCHQGTTEAPQCFRVCRTQLNCGRHACEERCCPGEHKAIDRLKRKRERRPLNSTARQVDDGFEAEHICMRTCGRLLSCGNHFCENLDHKGPCHTCREAIFEEISCNCGRTVLQPPLPCGTKPPPCRYDCERPKACGHPQVPHNCHGDSESCPRCPFLVEKTCLCSKKTLKNQQCWFTDVRCGEPCGRKLKCGSHFCRKTCHAPGDCEDAAGACTHQCGKPKKACGHPDEARCHAPYPCKEDQPCPAKIIITCDCQNHKQELRCSASKSSEGNTTKTLKCDDECLRLERNRKLALALNIDQANHTDDHIPYSQDTLALFAEHPKWATDQEREFRVFAADNAEKRLRFKPMPAHQRQFLHLLAEDFGFDSESMDPEPHRHVAIFKTPRFVAPPMKTLRSCTRLQKVQAKTAAEEAKAKEKARSSLMNDPYNGFLLTNPRFALMLDDIETTLAAVQEAQLAVLAPVASDTPAQTATKLSFNIAFLSNGNVALKVRQAAAQTDRVVEASTLR